MIRARDLDAVGHMLDLIRKDLPAVYRHFAEQRAQVDGHAAGTDTPKVSHTAELTPVEAMASQLETMRGGLEQIETSLTQVIINVGEVARTCRKVLGTRTAGPPRCDGRGLEGYETWGDPACTRSADKRGLSHDCYMRMYRWRVDNHLPPLRDTGEAA
jgi:hypothetical protein